MHLLMLLIYYFRLRGAGLLTFCRLVEGFVENEGARRKVTLDKSLLTALVDRWRPETHTFHLPCGEMAPTLQDVGFLLGLPLAGTPVGPRVISNSWKDHLEARFHNVQRRYGPPEPHPESSRGPSKKWFLQF